MNSPATSALENWEFEIFHWENYQRNMLTEGVITDNLSDISVGEMVSLQVRSEKTEDQWPEWRSPGVPGPASESESVSNPSVSPIFYEISHNKKLHFSEERNKKCYSNLV